ncbi:MAG: flippase-like domain-containing protein [Lachnospiraceae bacterium]|nr:flippase-like domain-containing protein [Lachnospiraceae bacterium]
MKDKKYIYNVLFLIVLMAGTGYFLLKDQEITEIIKYIKQADKGYLLLGFCLVIIYVSFESIIIHYLMKSLSYAVKFIHCLKYSFIGFFVSAITPSATGGQPAQLYYMSSDGISMAVSSLVLMVVTVAYKVVLLVLGILMFVIKFDFVMEHISNIALIMIYGVAVNLVVIGFLLFVIFKQSFAKKSIGKFILFLGKIKILKNHKKLLKKVINSISKYEDGAVYLKEHKVVFLVAFIITFIQRIALFAVTYAVYRAFGLTGYSVVEIVILQLIISIAVDNLPLPGGMGASEGIFIIFFREIFTSAYITAGLLLSRGLSYYLIIIMGGIITAFAQVTRKKRVNDKQINSHS